MDEGLDELALSKGKQGSSNVRDRNDNAGRINQERCEGREESPEVAC